MKIGVFLPNWVGDVVMATPTLRALRKLAGAKSKLIGIMKPRVAPVLEGTPWLDKIWLFDGGGPGGGMTFWGLVRRLHRARLDLAVLLPNTRRPALAAWLGGARQRAGYVRYGRGPLLTRKLHPPMEHGKYVPCSTVDYYLVLARAVGCGPEPTRVELATTEEDERAADRAWDALGLRRDGHVFTFNASGAFGAAKLWPEEYFEELARRVVRDLGGQVLVLCGPDERERAARLASAAGLRDVVSLADQELSIGLSKACVRRSRLLVTTDSGPRHFAAAFDVPVVSLFGPTHPAWGDNHYEKDRILRIPVDCGPCQERTCPLGHHRCMRDLSVDRVYDAVRRLHRETRGPT